MAKLSPEQQRLYNYLSNGRKPVTHIWGLFSQSTISSLLKRNTIRLSDNTGYYELTRVEV